MDEVIRAYREQQPGNDGGSRMNTATDHGDIPATLLLDASVIDDPYAFYRRLVAEAPVWCVPGTKIVIVSSFDAVTEVVSRVDDFSSNLRALLYRNADGTPELLPFEAGGLQVLAVADPPVHSAHRSTVFPELVAHRMAALRPDVEALAKERLAAALSRPQFEVMDVRRDLRAQRLNVHLARCADRNRCSAKFSRNASGTASSTVKRGGGARRRGAGVGRSAPRVGGDGTVSRAADPRAAVDRERCGGKSRPC